jgi:molybdopterin-guanine dinucleotide biosynthesis protein A
MGAPKAAIELAGRPLIAYAIDAIVAAGLEPVVVAKPDSEIPDVDCPVVRETEAAQHPAAGILAALRAGGNGPVVVVACDMPFVAPQLVAWLAAVDAPAAIPRVGGRLHPLLARYTPTVELALETAVREATPLQETAAGLRPLIVERGGLSRFGDPERITFNVNDRDDLAAAERLMSVAAPGR